jgi:hypothetical protein
VACPLRCSSITPRASCSSATPTALAATAGTPELLALAEECGFTPRLCRPYRAKTKTKGKVERFNGYLKGSFLVPLAASLKAAGLALTAAVASRHVRRWLDEVANEPVHATTGAVPSVRLAQERALMLPAPALKAPSRPATKVLTPTESLQHPLAVYDELLRMLREMAA